MYITCCVHMFGQETGQHSFVSYDSRRNDCGLDTPATQRLEECWRHSPRYSIITYNARLD